MSDKRNSLKFEDYIEPRSPSLNLLNTCSSLNRSLAQFKLDRIYPRNINMKLYLDAKKNSGKKQKNQLSKNNSYFKGSNCYQNKFYHQYIHLREDQQTNKVKKSKISHIFNIRSINLLQKSKLENQKLEMEKISLNQKNSSKEFKRNRTEKNEKDDLKGLSLMILDKKSHSPDQPKKSHDRKSSYFQPKMLQNCKNNSMLKNGDDKFETKLNEYYQYLRQLCDFHGVFFREIDSYGKNTINFFVGKGNNGHLIKETLKKRWWWTVSQEKNKKNVNFVWTQLKEKTFFEQKQKRSLSTHSEQRSKSSSISAKNRDNSKQKAQSAAKKESNELLVHNHFENNEFLGNKKALYYNMKAYYQKQNKKVFDFLPVTFHVKRYNDETWQQFEKYYYEDVKKYQGERRLWIVKPGQNSNRGNGIMIFSDFQKLREWVELQISEESNTKKTFIIQKYIDKPFLYNKRKFDIRCYMLLVSLNSSIKGYWYNDGYIRTSCFDYHVEDQNAFVHLTNDAIQINCEKYGKYEDGNKLSFHNFQKYLDHSHKGINKNFVEDICPQLKKIATDSIQACYHLLGEWNGFPTFELFGLDFMIDQSFKPWLIQINTNPCIETGSTTLERVIPRMIDNAFKLSLDVLFPPPLSWQNSKKHYLPNKVVNNLFELIFDESMKTKAVQMSDKVIMEMGEIEQDNQIYDQSTDKDNILSRTIGT